MLSRAEVAALLKQQPHAVVSTIWPSGTIQSTLVHVEIYADEVGCTTVVRSCTAYNLQRNSACTVTIQHTSGDGDRAYGLHALCSDLP